MLLEEENRITEGPGFNIFTFIEGRLATSKSGILEGISFRIVIEICESLDIPCEATDISIVDLSNAEEVFTAKTASGIVPVTHVDARILGNDVMAPMTADILKTY